MCEQAGTLEGPKGNTTCAIRAVWRSQTWRTQHLGADITLTETRVVYYVPNERREEVNDATISCLARHATVTSATSQTTEGLWRGSIGC